jgi:hypothetical protein
VAVDDLRHVLWSIGMGRHHCRGIEFPTLRWGNGVT